MQLQLCLSNPQSQACCYREWQPFPGWENRKVQHAKVKKAKRRVERELQGSHKPVAVPEPQATTRPRQPDHKRVHEALAGGRQEEDLSSDEDLEALLPPQKVCMRSHMFSFVQQTAHDNWQLS